MVARTRYAAFHARPAPHRAPASPTWGDADERARHYLRLLGREDHPDAEDNPVYALYQVAVDLKCTADGYRALYVNREGAPE